MWRLLCAAKDTVQGSEILYPIIISSIIPVRFHDSEAIIYTVGWSDLAFVGDFRKPTHFRYIFGVQFQETGNFNMSPS